MMALQLVTVNFRWLATTLLIFRFSSPSKTSQTTIALYVHQQFLGQNKLLMLRMFLLFITHFGK